MTRTKNSSDLQCQQLLNFDHLEKEWSHTTCTPISRTLKYSTPVVAVDARSCAPISLVSSRGRTQVTHLLSIPGTARTTSIKTIFFVSSAPVQVDMSSDVNNHDKELTRSNWSLKLKSACPWTDINSWAGREVSSFGSAPTSVTTSAGAIAAAITLDSLPSGTERISPSALGVQSIARKLKVDSGFERSTFNVQQQTSSAQKMQK